MSERNEEPRRDPDAAAANARSSDETANGQQKNRQDDRGDPQAVESTPRGTTEDPDRTL